MAETLISVYQASPHLVLYLIGLLSMSNKILRLRTPLSSVCLDSKHFFLRLSIMFCLLETWHFPAFCLLAAALTFDLCLSSALKIQSRMQRSEFKTNIHARIHV